MAVRVLQKGERVWITSETGKGEVLGQVVSGDDDRVTVEYSFDSMQLRKRVQPHSLLLKEFTDIGSADKLYHQFLRVLHKETDMDFDTLRKTRVESVIQEYCAKIAKMEGRPAPSALFVTGCICAGKTIFLKNIDRFKSLFGHVSLDECVHVNGDDIRSLLVGSHENSKLLLTMKDKLSVDRADINNVRFPICDIAREKHANFVADSLTVPSNAILEFQRAGYSVAVVYLEIGICGTALKSVEATFEKREEIQRQRMEKRGKEGGNVITVNPGSMKGQADEMTKCARELAEHGIKVHRIISENNTFVVRGLMYDAGTR